ncbi:MAG: hypothetical protein HZC25_03445 [Rhodospirillales bacterium]|nr:hypothetical protein [Rhodospirillales bacterium]
MTDEHIVPLSLGGQHIILKASCDACADITKRFEQDVARGLWGDARISYNAPSRRKKKRPTHFALGEIIVPYSQYPAPMVFYSMTRAGLLEGMPEAVDLSPLWTLVALSDHERNMAFEQKHGAPLTAKFRHVPDSFARLLAKIGYGQVLCSLDPGEFRPICVPYILGKKNPSFVVGGSALITEPNADVGYMLATTCFGTSDKIMLIATIRLFANNSSPTYHVVVGDVTGRLNVATALEKLGGIEVQQIDSARCESGIHWSPACWPLPFWRR